MPTLGTSLLRLTCVVFCFLLPVTSLSAFQQVNANSDAAVENSGSEEIEDSKQVVEQTIKVMLNAEGQLAGYTFAMLDEAKSPIASKVALASPEGELVGTVMTDATGNFSFGDVAPGTYTMMGVAGEYIGNQTVEVTPFTSAGEYTAMPLQVSPNYDTGAVYNSYSSMPMESLSCGAAPTQYYGGYSMGSCGSTCGSCCGGGGLLGGNGGGGFLSRLSPIGKLALIGGTIGLAVGIDGPSSPDE